MDFHQHPIIILKDVNFKELNYLVKVKNISKQIAKKNTSSFLYQFMYSGEAIVPQDDISSFLKTAETLEIKGLLENNSQETKNNKNKTSNTHHFGSACFKNSELTVTAKKFDKTDCQSSSQVTNINSAAAKLCKSNPLIRAYEANTKRSAVTSTHSSQDNKKSNRNYEATAPVFDNRNIYPVDVVQPHFDYSGKAGRVGVISPEVN